MKRAIILLFFCGFIKTSFCQTSDFVVSLLLKYVKDKNLCPYLSNDPNLTTLTKKGNDSCVYRCDFKNMRSKADSIILSIGFKPSLIYDLKLTVELCQYYNNLDSAKEEYTNYLNSLIQEFNSDSKFYRYSLTKIKDSDSGDSKIWLDNYFVDLIELRSMYVWANLYLSLEKEHENFVILTRIN